MPHYLHEKSDGMVATTDNENAEVFYQHFDKVFNNQSLLPCDKSALDLIDQSPNFTHLEETPSLLKVCTALHWMANGKASGPSSVTSDALKAMIWTKQGPDNDADTNDANCLITMIHAMLLDFWSKNTDFESWSSGILSPVPKKGNFSNPNKWQPVCLLETTYEVLASILAQQINLIIQDHGLEAQCSSLNSKGCPDANFLLESALQIR
eukprot:1338951-Ditylum_brightwellii.AAC.1